MPDEILTLAEVAQMLKVADKTVYTMAQRGEVPAFKVRGQWRFKRDDLDQWIERQKLSQAITTNLMEGTDEPTCPRWVPAMMTTDCQAKYFAYDLTRRYAPDSAERMAGAVAGAQVDLNPHQVDAALFAFASPLSKGALLADEVGLGKTIEAGLVISQRWAERKRRILIIAPSNLRKQWHQELQREVLPPLRHPGIEVVQSGHQGRQLPAVGPRWNGRHLFLPVRAEQGG